MSRRIPKPPDGLIDALKNGKAIAIVGSGLSIQAGGPSWEKVLYGIAIEAQDSQPDKLRKIASAIGAIKEGQFLDAAALLHNVLGNDEFRRSVVKQITQKREFEVNWNTVRKVIESDPSDIDSLFSHTTEPTSLDCRPTISHYILLRLGFRGIITTNYDPLLEQAAPSISKLPVFTNSTNNLAELIKTSNQFIFKIHGDINNPRDIIITRDDYASLIQAEVVPEIVKNLLHMYHPFWIGYGHRDTDIDPLLDTLRIKLKLNGGTAVVTSDNHVLKQRLSDAGISASVLPAYESIPAYLNRLAEECKGNLAFEINLNNALSDSPNIDQHINNIIAVFFNFKYKIKYLGPGSASTQLYFSTNADTYHTLKSEISKERSNLASTLLKTLASYSVRQIFDRRIDHKDISINEPSVYPVNGGEKKVSIEFVNREDSLRNITRTHSAHFMLLSAPTGYGKTRLLNQVESQIGDEFYCLNLKLDRHINHSVLSIAKEILASIENISPQLSSTINPSRLGGAVGLKILHALGKQGKSKVLLIIDVLEALNSKHVEPFLKDFLPAIVKVINQHHTQINLRIILSGRYISNWELIASPILSLEPEPLNPFDFNAVYQTVSKFNATHEIKMNDGFLMPFASQLMIMTGGHPGCMAEILNSGDYGMPIEGIKENEDTYFKEIILPVIKKIESDISKDLKPIFDRVSPLRRFNTRLLQFLIEKGLLEWHEQVGILEDKLLQTYLVKNDQGFCKDEITRRLFAIRLRRDNLADYLCICREAVAFYKEQLDKLDAFQPHVISVEILFLHLQIALTNLPGDWDEFVQHYKGLLGQLKKFTYEQDIIKAFKQLLREDWEFQFIYNYIFPQKTLSDLFR